MNGVYVLSAKRHKRVSKWYCAANDLTIFRCSMQQRYESLVKRVLPSMVTYCAVTYCSLTVHLFLSRLSLVFLLLSTPSGQNHWFISQADKNAPGTDKDVRTRVWALFV